MLLKTSELSGLALDYAVAQCEGIKCHIVPKGFFQYGKLVTDDDWDYDNDCAYELNFSTDWSQGGPIIEREEIDTLYLERWIAYSRTNIIKFGPTPLIAAMRCYVTSKLGDEVDIPTELLEK